MDPFSDYIPDPPSLDYIHDRIDKLDISIAAFERLESQGKLSHSVAIEYFRGIRRLWEAIRCGEVLSYESSLPKGLQELQIMRDDLRQSVAQARQENEQILNSLARDFENGVDALIMLGCDEPDIAILEGRIARIQAAIDFLSDNL
jgi:hypothetical protein